jgi:hypothetical protein
VTYYRDIDGDEPSNPAKPVPNVSMSVAGTAPASTTTDGGGLYAFVGVWGNETITAKRVDTVHDPAITSADAVAISKSVVKLINLTPRQKIAGDVSNNGSVTAYDASLVAQYAAHLFAPYGASGAHFPVSNANRSDWTFDPGSRTYSPVTGTVSDANIVGLLFGDVTGNWPVTDVAALAEPTIAIPTSPEPVSQVHPRTGPATIYVPERPTRVPGTLDWKFVLAIRDADGIEGLDLVVRFGRSGVRFKELRTVGIASSMTAVGNLVESGLKIALFGARPLSGSGSVLEITVTGESGAGVGTPTLFDASANEGLVPIAVRPMPKPLGPARSDW